MAVGSIAFPTTKTSSPGLSLCGVAGDESTFEMRYWDTETGQIISTFTNKKTPFCVPASGQAPGCLLTPWKNLSLLSEVSVHPDPSQQNVIVTGCSNKKARRTVCLGRRDGCRDGQAVQWDSNTCTIVQDSFGLLCSTCCLSTERRLCGRSTMNTWALSTRRQSVKMESADTSAVVDAKLPRRQQTSAANVLSGLLTSSDDKKPLSEQRTAIPDRAC